MGLDDVEMSVKVIVTVVAHKLASFTVTVYTPAVKLLMAEVVFPLIQL